MKQERQTEKNQTQGRTYRIPVRQKQKEQIIVFALLLLLNVVCVSSPVLANSTAIDGKFNILTDMVKSFVSSIGTIVTLWGLFEWGNAMQSNDGMMQSAAMKRIGGGLVMSIGPQLLSSFIS